MYERDALALGAEPGVFVDEPETVCPASFERGVQVVDRKAHVVDAGPASGHESSDRRLGCLGLQQLDHGFARGEGRDASAVGAVYRNVGHAEYVAVERRARVQAGDRNADVCDRSASRRACQPRNGVWRTFHGD